MTPLAHGGFLLLAQVPSQNNDLEDALSLLIMAKVTSGSPTGSETCSDHNPLPGDTPQLRMSPPGVSYNHTLRTKPGLVWCTPSPQFPGTLSQAVTSLSKLPQQIDHSFLLTPLQSVEHWRHNLVDYARSGPPLQELWGPSYLLCRGEKPYQLSLLIPSSDLPQTIM